MLTEEELKGVGSGKLTGPFPLKKIIETKEKGLLCQAIVRWRPVGKNEQPPLVILFPSSPPSYFTEGDTTITFWPYEEGEIFLPEVVQARCDGNGSLWCNLVYLPEKHQKE